MFFIFRSGFNKNFLHNTLRGALSSNKFKQKKLIEKSRQRKNELEAKIKEDSIYRKRYLTTSTKKSKITPAESPKKESRTSSPKTERTMCTSFPQNEDEFSDDVIGLNFNNIPPKVSSKSELLGTELALRSISFVPASSKEDSNTHSNISDKIFNKQKSLSKSKIILKTINFVPASESLNSSSESDSD